MSSITKEILKYESNHFDLECIFQLELKKKNLNDLGCINECTNLEILDLSYNQLSDLISLKALINLKYLNLSCNHISNIDGIQYLEQLKSLNLAGNLISSLKSIELLANIPTLINLRLADNKNELRNPMCLNVSYKKDVCAILVNLEQLDDDFIKTKHKNVFEQLDDIEKFNSNDLIIELESGNTNFNEPWFTEDLFEPLKKEYNPVDVEIHAFSRSLEMSQDILNETREYLKKLDAQFHV